MSLKHRVMFLRLFGLCLAYARSCDYIVGIVFCLMFFIALRFLPFLCVAWVIVHFVKKWW